MNRSISLHPFSLVLGLAFGVLCLVAMGQTSVSVTPIGTTVRIQYVPDPRDYVQITGTTPYTVPSGKLFVLTGLGKMTTAYSVTPELVVNGQPQVQSYGNGPSTDSTTVQSVPLGFTVPAGSQISIIDWAGCTLPGCLNNLQAWGYLAPQ